MTSLPREGDADPPQVKGVPPGDDTLGMEAIEGPVARTGGTGVVVHEPAGARGDRELPSPVLLELHELPLPALRRRHDLLEAELRRVRYWQRLLRARRDLVVAGTVAPDELAVPLEAAAQDGPLERHLGAVAGDEAAPSAPGHVLRTLVLPGAASADGPSRLAELQDATARLAAYAAAVADEHAFAVQVLAERRGLLAGARG